MKKWLIGSLVGAILLFLWQFLSWTVLQTHLGESKYTSAQDSILSYLGGTLKESGSYLMPNVSPETSMSDAQKMAEQWDGKPSAIIIYNTSFKHEMTMPMIRGFLVDIFLVFTLIYVLTRGGVPKGLRVFAGSVAVGLMTFLVGPYTMHIWFQTPTEAYTGHLIDAIVSWGLVGIWLGWWLNRK